MWRGQGEGVRTSSLTKRGRCVHEEEEAETKEKKETKEDKTKEEKEDGKMEGERTALLRSYSNGTSRWNRNSTVLVLSNCTYVRIVHSVRA